MIIGVFFKYLFRCKFPFCLAVWCVYALGLSSRFAKCQELFLFNHQKSVDCAWW